MLCVRRMICRVAVSVILVLLTANAFAAVDYGVQFNSYDFSPSQRTSLVFPAGKRAISFRDSLQVGFSVRLNLKIGRFGYICRIILDNSQSVDVLLFSPEGEPTAIGVTSDSEYICKFPIIPGSWQDFMISIEHRDEELVVKANGRTVAFLPSRGSTHAARVFFGQTGIPEFATNDVAPMTLRELSFKADRHSADLWPLDSPEELKHKHTYSCQANNALWLKDLYMHWNKQWEMVLPTNAYMAYDSGRSCMWIVCEDQVLKYNLSANSCAKYMVRHDIAFSKITNDFVVLPDGRLSYVDFDAKSTIDFDENAGDWTADNPRKGKSLYLHSNVLRDSASASYLQVFGYGQHRYHNCLVRWFPQTGEFSKSVLGDIGPRYLSCAGIKGDSLYVFGGKGNPQGAQEFGTRLYADFWAVSLKDYSSHKKWSLDTGLQEVAAPELVFSDEDSSFLALCYDPNVYDSALQLRRFNMSDGRSEALSEPIPYNFLDIQSEAHLVYDRAGDAFYAFVSYVDMDKRNRICVYKILNPVVSAEKSGASGVNLFLVIPISLLILALLCAGAYFAFFRRKPAAPEVKQPIKPAAPEVKQPIKPAKLLKNIRESAEGPAIRLLGGFRVITADGSDISSAFSPLMKQLLSILILNADKKDGISNADLKDALWFDKSDESYNNNRGVTLKRIRTLMEKVDSSLAIISRNGSWTIVDPKGICDYIRAAVCLAQERLALPDALAISRLGTLLPDLRYEWLDSYKAAYDERMIALLRSFTPELERKAGYEDIVAVSDALLCFDHLDEEAVRRKCCALVNLKRMGTAKKTYDAFREEYLTVMGEDFSLSFSDFVKISPN